jgi:hypothetical protein
LLGSLTPQRRTRVVSQSLKPLWREVFHFDGARAVSLENGVVMHLGTSVTALSGKPLTLMVTLDDYDFGR